MRDFAFWLLLYGAAVCLLFGHKPDNKVVAFICWAPFSGFLLGACYAGPYTNLPTSWIAIVVVAVFVCGQEMIITCTIGLRSKLGNWCAKHLPESTARHIDVFGLLLFLFSGLATTLWLIACIPAACGWHPLGATPSDMLLGAWVSAWLMISGGLIMDTLTGVEIRRSKTYYVNLMEARS